MKLLTEWCALNVTKEMIKESREMYGGKIVLKGPIQKANTLNQNGRIYPKHVLEREIMNYQKLIQENRAMGECDHPDSSVIELTGARGQGVLLQVLTAKQLMCKGRRNH